MALGRNCISSTDSAAALPLLLAFGLAAAWLGGCATYSQAPEPVPAMSPSERAARAEELFTMLDTDGDGYLTREEMQGGLRYITQADAPATRNLMLGARKTEGGAKNKEKRKQKKLSDEEIAKLVEEAFVKRVDHSMDVVSKEDFKRIVVGPGNGSSSTGTTWNEVL